MTMVMPMISPYRVAASVQNAVPITRMSGVRGSVRNRSNGGTSIQHHKGKLGRLFQEIMGHPELYTIAKKAREIA